MCFLISVLLALLSYSMVAQEICDNGIDDDGNGLIDCVDPSCICNICSNRQASIWYFGNQVGLGFNLGEPTVLTDSEMNTSEGCAVMSDANGNLLFYTDGVTIWNRQHQVMPNGSGLLGNTSSSQSVLIVPHPSDFSLYYVFTVDAADVVGVADGFRYSVVDLSLNDGLGDVSTKNELLLENTTEKVMAVKHCNNKSVWVLAHEWNTANFYVYEITEDGFNSTPFIQNIGTVHTGGSLGQGNMAGYLKSSIDGKRIACAIRDSSIFELFDFDTYTGILSNPVKLQDPTWGWVYGVEFSPDGRLLYGSSLLTSGKVRQFDLMAGSANAIQSSGTVIASKSGLGALQIGLNEKIYVANYNSEKMDVINSPNTVGIGCNYQDSAIVFPSGRSILGLPNFIQSYFYNELPVCADIPNFDVCQGKVFMPDVFSPNADGVNDYFRPVELDTRYILDFKIYNNWGQVVYDNTDKQGWDGFFKKVPQPSGVYLYLLKTQLPGQDLKVSRGSFSLLR